MHGWDSKPHIVLVRWIAESIQLKHPADESNFLIHQEVKWEQQPSKMPSTATQRSSISTSMVDYNDETHIDEALLHEQSLGPRERKERRPSMEEIGHDVSTLPQSQASELPGIFIGELLVFFWCTELFRNDKVLLGMFLGELLIYCPLCLHNSAGSNLLKRIL